MNTTTPTTEGRSCPYCGRTEWFVTEHTDLNGGEPIVLHTCANPACDTILRVAP